MRKHYDFVASAPKGLCAWLVNGAPHTTAEEKRVVEKLLTKPKMDDAWQKLNKSGYKFLNTTDIGPLAFLSEVLKIWNSWTQVPKMTAAQLAQEIDQTVEAASALAERLSTSQTDLGMTAILRELDLELVRDGAVIPDFDEPTLSQVLVKYAQLIRQHRSRLVATSLSQPKSGWAKNRFFCIELSRYFVSNCGRPLHPVVAAFHNAVFDNRILDEKEVEQLVSSKGPRKSKTARKTSSK